MTRTRTLLAIAALLSSLALAVHIRDVFHDLIVVLLSNILWQLWLFDRAIPELPKWIVLVTLLGLVMVWQLIPAIGPSPPNRRASPQSSGQVESLAVWMARARGSNYFKWQVANRLARVSRKLDELAGRPPDAGPASDVVASYLAAGTDHSFVDFPAPRRSFQRRIDTPLDADPAEVVAYLESQSSMERRGDVEGL
jgi:hypothetical protein